MGGLAWKVLVNRMPLPLDVLADSAQRRVAAGRGKVGRGPEMSARRVPVHAAGELRSQMPGRHALQAVHQRRDSHLRWVSDQEMYVVVFPVELAQFRAEVAADFPHGILAAAEHVRVKHATSVFCHEDQMDVEGGNHMSARPIVIIECHRPMLFWCRAGQVPIPHLPGSGPAASPSKGVRLCAGGIQRLPAGSRRGVRKRGEDQRHRDSAPV